MICMLMENVDSVYFVIFDDVVADNFINFNVDQNVILLSTDYNGYEFSIKQNVYNFQDIENSLWLHTRNSIFINILNKMVGK